MTNDRTTKTTILIALVGLTAIVYWPTRSSLIVGDDGETYLSAIRAGRQLFHPHHLIFNAACRFLLNCFAPFGATVETVVVLHNLVWVIISAGCTCALVGKLTNSVWQGVIASLYVVFANSTWFFALQYEAYPAAVGSGLAALWFAANSTGS